MKTKISIIAIVVAILGAVFWIVSNSTSPAATLEQQKQTYYQEWRTTCPEFANASDAELEEFWNLEDQGYFTKCPSAPDEDSNLPVATVHKDLPGNITPDLGTIAQAIYGTSTPVTVVLLDKGIDCENYELLTTLVNYQGENVMACVHITLESNGN